MKILITGASGFIGSHMIDYALQLGYETWAAIRSTSSLQYLQNERIHFIKLDYTNETALYHQLLEHSKQYGLWDIIIHCAGATKCIHRKDFFSINYIGTQHFTQALIRLNMVPSQFIFISTLGSYGPIHEEYPYLPIIEADIPQPNTAYGQSKRMAEEYLMGLEDFPYIIFRPTGVYGPREKDYQILIDSIRNHLELSLGFHPQHITFVYIKDLVQAVFLLIKKGIVRRTYFVTDGQTYDSHTFGNLVRQATGYPTVLHVTVPLWLGRIAATICDSIGFITHRSFTLNGDKFRILRQRNWTCDITPLITDLGYSPAYDLKRGIEETIRSQSG